MGFEEWQLENQTPQEKGFEAWSRSLPQSDADGPDDIPDYAAMARRAFGPELEVSSDFDTAVAKLQRDREPELKRARAKVKTGAKRAGLYAPAYVALRSAANAAEMYSDLLESTQEKMYDSMDLEVPEHRKDLHKAIRHWSTTWKNATEWWRKKHPDAIAEIDATGFKNVTKELLTNPVKTLNLAMQSVPLMLEAMLPAGMMFMVADSAANHYAEIKAEAGDRRDPESMALQALVTAVPEAAIERFTLGKRFTLFRDAKHIIGKGSRRVFYELVKAYARGVGEESSQTLNRNIWWKLFEDHSQDIWEGVKESAASGGILETVMSTSFIGAGKTRSYVGKDAKLRRVERIRRTLTDQMTDEGDVSEVHQVMDDMITRIKAGEFEQHPTVDQVEAAEYGLTPERTDELFGYAEARFQELESRRQVSRTQKGVAALSPQEFVEWKFLKDHRDDIHQLLEVTTRADSPVDYLDPDSNMPVMPRSKSQYKNMVMNMVHRLTEQDIARGVERREARSGAQTMLSEAIIQVTGKKKGLKQLSGKELHGVADLMADFAADGVLEELDWANHVEINGERVPMHDVMNAARHTVDNLTPKKRVKTRVGKTLRRLKDFFFSIDNTPLYHLAKRLDGGDEHGIYSQVLDKNLRAGHRVEARHNRTVFQHVRDQLAAAGVSEADLVRMSTALDPVRSALRTVMEHLPTELSGTQEKTTVTLGGKEYALTWAEMIDLYLISNQKDGFRHLTGGGLVINGQTNTDTGQLTAQEIADVRDLVEDDEKAQAVVKLMMGVSENVWKPSVNETSQSLDGRKIAKIDNWWGLEVLKPRELGGEKHEFNVNLAENKSIFRDRTHSSRPLVLRDAWTRFNVFQGAIANYYGMAEPLRIARTVLNDNTLWDAYRMKGMEDVMERSKKLLQHAQGTVHTKNVLEGVLDHIMPRFYQALLYYNPKVWMSQYTSVVNYGSYASSKYMKEVPKSLTSVGDRSLWEEMLSTSDLAYERFHTGKATLELGVAGESDAVRQNVIGKASWGNKAAVMLKGPDMAALLAGWQIAKAEFTDHQAGVLEGRSTRWWAGQDVSNIEEGTDEYRELIKQRAEYLWQRTQPSWDMYNRSVITNMNKLARSFLMFRSFHEKVLTIWNDAKVDYDASEKSQADQAEFASRVAYPVASYVLNATMRAVVGYVLFGQRKEFPEIATEVLISPLDAFPVVGPMMQDKIDALVKGLNEEQVYLNNDNLESIPLRILTEADKNATALMYGLGLLNMDKERGEKEVEKQVLKLIGDAAMLLGVPTPTIKGIMRGLDDQAKTNDDAQQGGTF
jgi:hypothetical protein